jgi:hypothetical protein
VDQYPPEVAAFNLTANYQLVGLMVYQDDDNYFYADHSLATELGTESIVEIAGSDTNLSRVPQAATTNLILRFDQTSASNHTSFHSLDASPSGFTISSGTANLKATRRLIFQKSTRSWDSPSSADSFEQNGKSAAGDFRRDFVGIGTLRTVSLNGRHHVVIVVA